MPYEFLPIVVIDFDLVEILKELQVLIDESGQVSLYMLSKIFRIFMLLMLVNKCCVLNRQALHEHVEGIQEFLALAQAQVRVSLMAIQ